MRMRSLFAFSLVAASAFGTSFAMANTVVDTIILPNPQDGPTHIGLSDHETQVVPVAQPILQGTGVAQDLEGGATQTYGNSKNVTATNQNGVSPASSNIITDVFSGFTLRTAVTVAGQTTLYFTGGMLNLYVSKTSQNVPNTTTGVTVAQAETNAGQASAVTGAPTAAYNLFLALRPQVEDAFGDTFITTLSGTPTSFTGATGFAYLDVVGGDAAFWFNTNAVQNPFTLGFADFQFIGSANLRGTGIFPVGGNDDLFGGNIVPEPITLSLFGAGLAGVAAARRRKAKKA